MSSWLKATLPLTAIVVLSHSLLICAVPAYAQVSDSLVVTYTEAQAAAGKIIYDVNCATCHGVNLEGAAIVPDLSGEGFAVKWSEAPTYDTGPLLYPVNDSPKGGAAIWVFALQ